MSTSVYLGVPTHSHSITTPTVVTLLDIQATATPEFSIHTVFHSASVISDLRNTIVANFLARGDDILFMLDSDQGVPAELVLRMLRSGYPVVGCLYPRRNFFWSQVDPNQPVGDMQRVKSQAMRFVGELMPDASGNVTVTNGFAPALYLGGGVLIVHRQVFEKLMLAYPDLAGRGFADEDENLPLSQFNWGFFNPLPGEDKPRPLGEDISFCERWRKGCGGEIFAEIETDNEHVGRMVFKGNFSSWLASRGPVDPAAQ